MIILAFILFNYGLSNIIIYSPLFEGLRNFLIKINPSFLGALVQCMMCLGLWTGVVSSFILQINGFPNLTPFYSLGINNIFLSLFMDGCITSGSIWLIHTLQEMMERINENE